MGDSCFLVPANYMNWFLQAEGVFDLQSVKRWRAGVLADLDLNKERTYLYISGSNNRDLSGKCMGASGFLTPLWQRVSWEWEPQLLKEVCASLLSDPLPASIYPIKVVEGMTCLLLSWFHSANPPSAFGVHDGLVLKQNHLVPKLKGSFLQLETTFETTGENHVPITYKLLYHKV